MVDDTGTNKERLWLDAEFRRRYPLTTQRLKETALEQQVDLGYERCMEVLRDLHAAAELAQKELTELTEIAFGIGGREVAREILEKAYHRSSEVTGKPSTGRGDDQGRVDERPDARQVRRYE